MEPDFSGYVTKAGIKCSDGRTISAKAFEHMDGKKVPLVWAHRHDDPDNILGHMLLEARNDGVYGYGFFNKKPKALSSKESVEHEDITSMSIYANQLKETLINGGKQVIHGMIREVSLVLAGANKGALIDFVAVRHGYGDIEVLDEDADIYTGLPLEHEDLPDKLKDVAEEDEESTEEVAPAEESVEESTESTEETVEGEEGDESAQHGDNDTIQDVLNTFNDDQMKVLDYFVERAFESSAKHSDTDNDEADLAHQEGEDMSRNIFEQASGSLKHSDAEGNVLVHEWTRDDMKELAKLWVKEGTLAHALDQFALAHGIENLESLFPEPTNLDGTPQWIKRETEWVAGVLSGVTHQPRSRIKNRFADITQDEARAKGYIKGTLKKEEWFSLTHRTTTPTTVYKKQKLDRDDILDASDFDIISWMKGEMQLMLREEIARAILVGDGREVDDEDKVKDPAGVQDGAGIRSIANDHEMFVTTVWVDDGMTDWEDFVEAVLRARRFYKGTGMPTLYTTEERITEMLLTKNGYDVRRYADVAELAKALRVRDVVAVEVMEDEAYSDILGIIVNLTDYVTGTDRGGEVTMFDDFDLDYNQEKRLIETRLCGALTKYKAAMVIRVGEGTLVTPTEPTFDATTGALTIPTVTGVTYKHGATTVNAAGSPYTVDPGDTWVIDAVPSSGSYYFATSEDDQWSFTADE